MKILKNLLLNSSYQLLLVIIPLITTPYISRVLGVHGVGLNTLTATIVQYFTIIAVLGTSIYGAREIAYHQNQKRERSNAFWGITFISFIMTSFSIICFLVFILCYKKYELVFLWQGIAILSVFFDISWYFRGIENFKIIISWNALVKVITIILIFVFVRNHNDLVPYIIILSLGTLFSNMILWVYLKSEIYKPELRNLNIKKHFYGSFALFIPTIAVQIYTVVNKNMIGVMDSINSLGLFNQSNMIIQTALAVVSTLNVVMLPRTSLLFSKGDLVGVRRNIIKTFNIAISIAVPVAFGLAAISLKFAPFFLGKQFRMVGLIMLVESPIIIFITGSNIVGGQYLVATNKTYIFSISAIVGAVSNVVMNLAFIPTFGVIGATVALVLSELLVISYQLYSIREEIPISDLFHGIWKYIVAGSIMFVVVLSLNFLLEMNIQLLILQVFIGILFYVLLNRLFNTYLWIEGVVFWEKFIAKN
ncbi:oligosaccharide flippase family protein [Lactococcus lactis]|uniref:oligosaccharide flippase family protein n=1 Tax=Lactococcus lactis TaxID=1358 RepID=UPI000BF7C25E|nr:oligosaccharide flippase family protein [Lactococcus lactis]PFG84915.1 hypothetical protein BW151_00690 [Lactococcus lactis]RJK91950.1 flippase [Lactococcus lactis subsp. lactis]